MSGFPNMAGKPDIDDALEAELEAAGIEVFRLSFLKNGKSEVNTEVVGGLHGWSFKRAWYYWRGVDYVTADEAYEYIKDGFDELSAGEKRLIGKLATAESRLAAAWEEAAKIIETTEMYGNTPEHPGVCYTSAAWRRHIASALRAASGKDREK